MTGFWRQWMTVWVMSVVGFGLLLIGAVFPGLDAPVRLLFRLFGDPLPAALSSHLAFALALMGAVSVGWGLSLLAILKALDLLGALARPVWVLFALSVVLWFVVDGLLSVYTGFPLNILPNTLLLAGFFIPVLATGALKQA